MDRGFSTGSFGPSTPLPHESVPLVELIEITRRFPGVVALDAVSLDLAAGEVHALVGENGAGKSTLINIVCGLLRPDSGRLRVAGRDVEWASPVDARRQGIVTVHQEAELFGTLSVAENMALEQGMPTGPAGWVKWGQIFAEAQHAVDLIGEPFEVRQSAAVLSVAQRGLTQIAAAVRQQARVLVLDEPTSALTVAETAWLFEQVARLKRRGVGILYISHRQEEIFQLADRITVLRDGRRVWSGPRGAMDRAGLIGHIAGRGELASAARPARPAAGNATPRLRISGFTAADGSFRDISLDVPAGEVLGVYGLVGSGRSELARAVFGLEAAEQGTLEVDGRAVAITAPSQAVAHGIAYLPEDRLRQGVFRGLSIRANTVITALGRLSAGPFTSARRERAATAGQIAALAIKCRDVGQMLGELSGGNQQKVVLARLLLARPAVLILDEPTRGVDVGAKAEIHRLLAQMADQGAAIVLISSDLPEVMENSDRIVVFRRGRIAGRCEGRQATSEAIAAVALGEAAPPGPKTRPKGARSTTARRWRGEWALALAVLALVALLSATGDSFLTRDNLWGLLSSDAVLTILALGAAATILAGGIDISLGALVALAEGVAGLVLKLDHPPAVTIPAAIAAALAIGAAGGLVNAGLALAGRVHPIVVTLGTMTVFRGLLIWLTGGETITDLPAGFVDWSSARLWGINASVAVGALAALVTYIWLAHLRGGRYVLALGASRTAAQLVGISPVRTWLAAFGAGGLLAALAGVVELSQTGAVQSGVGVGYELTAIAAAVIGGVSISGGRGSVAGICLGALLLSLIYNALVLWQVSRYHYSLVTGALLLAAVLVDLAWRRLGQ
jgi:ABC-type sugar transport system ATPase subunit/ribose/xylose/arabinose/galactoside ABC-type transport system permease subunit